MSAFADCQNECRNSLQPKGSVQVRRPAFHPVQQPGNCTLPWPVGSSSVARASSHWQYIQESDADVAVDVDCCGDSGSMSKLCITHPIASTRPRMSSCSGFGNTASAQGFKKHKKVSDVDTNISQVWSVAQFHADLSCLYNHSQSCHHRRQHKVRMLHAEGRLSASCYHSKNATCWQ